MLHSTWIEIDSAAIANNVRQMQAIAQTAVMAVVKANGYGHGAEIVAKAALTGGATWLGVARVEEGLALRAVGIEAPILVMGHTPPAQAAEAIRADLSLVVYDFDSAQAYSASAQSVGRPAKLHLKVDTGMGRLGVMPEDALAFFNAVQVLPNIHLEGLMTHFANADAADLTHTREQLAKFKAVLVAGLRPPLIHAANSATALVLPEARFDMVRMGIALYGLHPSDDVPLPTAFRPALSWKAMVTQVKTLPPGHSISYNCQYTTTESETIAAVSVGYADGYRRVLNRNEVLIGGQRAPVRGRVCMDQIVVGVSHISNVQAGDEVVLLGTQRGATISAEDLARKWGTINYDVVCGLAARVGRRET